jgi:tetratricopeptide (TPR) repeat protein
MKVRVRLITLFLITLSLTFITDYGCSIQSGQNSTSSTIPITTFYAAKQRNEYAVKLANEKKYDEAIDEFTQAIEICPEYIELYFNRGTTYCWMKEYEKAIEDFCTSISLNESYHEAYNGRGCAYSGMNQHDEAIANFTEAISLDPMNAEYYFNRGCAYKALGNELRASTDFHHCIDFSRDSELTQKAREMLSEPE